MSKLDEFFATGVSRRDFIVQASTAAGFCLLNCDGAAGQADTTTIVKALDNNQVIHGKVSFPSGQETIDAYLARPRRQGRFPVVIVVTGNSISEEYIQNTTALLAEKDFVGIAPNIFSLQKDSMSAEEKRRVFVEQITDENIFRDLQSSIDYLKTQNFARPKRMGIMGFCFGGRCALMFAVKSKEIAAVAPFYGNLRTPAFANRKQDPLDLLDQIKVPVQGHYSDNDPEILLDQLKSLEMNLHARGVPVEIFTYAAQHGFFAYTRRTYQAEAAKTSWQRTAEFFRKHLSK
jgi:Dienelactone hydrolase and related enzymes